jgi:serine protease Do
MKKNILQLNCFYKLILQLVAISFLMAPALLPAQESPPVNTTQNLGLPNFSGLIKNLTPVTVNVSSTKTVKSRFHQFGSPYGGGGDQSDPFREFFGDDFYRRFFGDNPNREYKQKGLGSGFIIGKDGYILTNNHVVEGADEIKVKMHNQKEYDAEIIGRDPKTDLALIKLKGVEADLTVAKLGDSDALDIGEWVIAIGNPFGLQETVTAGIVSAKWRKIGAGPYEDFIQTDASINPGNSGGPLFNLKGEVVGINTMIFSPSGGNVGIGFAIPINLAKNVVQQLKEKGRVVRGWLGVVIQMVTPELAESFGLEEGKGALVADISENGPADKAGITPGDIIIQFDEKDVKDMSQLPLMVAETPVGKKVKVSIIRDGKRKVVIAETGELEDKPAENIPEKEKDNLGLTARQITPEMANMYGFTEEEGVIISNVSPGSPAEDAGLRKGDIIKEINRKPIKILDEYYNAIKDRKSENMLMLIKRGRTSLWVVLKPKT